MSDPLAQVIVIDDEPHILQTMGICLESAGFSVTLCEDPQKAVSLFQTQKIDLAFVDLKMSPIDGLQMLDIIRQNSPDTTVILITAHGSIDTAIEAIKKGAYHYLLKPFDFKELQVFAQKALEYHSLVSEVQHLREKVIDTGPFLTRNKEMLDVLQLAIQIADSSITVLIEGESGTGKELIAQLIHAKSSRAKKPFVKVNCAALPSTLLESELFGHVKGAFTGAVRDREGRFEAAHGGTIFLDEIAELDTSLQVKLLRVIQHKEFERVGDNTTRRVDVRIIAATNRNLSKALADGTFREDLYYRLSAVRLKVLALRERLEDIPLLAKHFAQKLAPNQSVRIAPETMDILRRYSWPGNVRELENVMERAVLLAKDGVIQPEHLPEEMVLLTMSPQRLPTLEEVEKEYIRRVLQKAKDFEEAARILGIDRTTLWRKREKYGL